MLGDVCACAPSHDVDVTLMKPDHIPVVLGLRTALLAGAPRLPRRRVPIADPKAFQDPVVRAALARAVESMPAIGWQVDANTHLGHVTERLREVVARIAPPQSAPRKRWVTDDVWNIIKFRRPHRAALFTSRDRAAPCRVALAWAAWTHRAHAARAARHQLLDAHARVAYSMWCLDSSEKALKDA
eukprot:9882957-Alexandrium_andersonii.AAC.1